MEKKGLILRLNLNSMPLVLTEKDPKRPLAAGANSARWVSLQDVEPGQKARVQRLPSQPALCRRLREMGFCEYAEVKILSKSGAMLCLVCHSKVCLSRRLAESVFVEPAEV